MFSSVTNRALLQRVVQSRANYQVSKRNIADFSLLNELRQADNTKSDKTVSKNGTNNKSSPFSGEKPLNSRANSPPPSDLEETSVPKVNFDNKFAPPNYELPETPMPNVNDNASTNWAASFHGLGGGAFSKDSQEVLAQELKADDIEITPDGLLYLPEIKYRRVLNRAFGAGAWGMAPRSETTVDKNDSGVGGLLSREYGLVVHGRLVSIARGEQTFFNDKGIATATEGCKSNALMRCCKDLGIASELWDPRFIKKFKKQFCEEIFVEYIPTKKKKKIWKRKDEDVEYPFKR